jgi:hypothetical protein
LSPDRVVAFKEYLSLGVVGCHFNLYSNPGFKRAPDDRSARSVVDAGATEIFRTLNIRWTDSLLLSL